MEGDVGQMPNPCTTLSIVKGVRLQKGVGDLVAWLRSCAGGSSRLGGFWKKIFFWLSQLQELLYLYLFPHAITRLVPYQMTCGQVSESKNFCVKPFFFFVRKNMFVLFFFQVKTHMDLKKKQVKNLSFDKKNSWVKQIFWVILIKVRGGLVW